jgi:hypothetical protein
MHGFWIKSFDTIIFADTYACEICGLDYAIRRYLRASNGDIRREIAIGRCPGASTEYREFQKAEER